MEEETSEFGQGFIYNLILFAKHFERFRENIKLNNEMFEKHKTPWVKDTDDTWFNGAGDHFYELEIPAVFEDTAIGKLAKELKEEAIERRLGTTTKKEFENFFDRLEELVMMIDRYFLVDVKKAQWN